MKPERRIFPVGETSDAGATGGNGNGVDWDQLEIGA